MQRFLCWDKKNFLSNDGVMVYQHKPEKKNIALVCEDEWEGVHNGYASVTKVGDTYRMYYRASGQNGCIYKNETLPQKGMVCIAESKDGITFTKPHVGKIDYNGSKDNNVVFWRDNGQNLDTFTVFYDTNPDCKEDEKFKALARDQATDILDLYVSADGYEFEFVERVNLNGTFDSYNTVFWDDIKKEYHCYYRGYHHPDGSLVSGIHEVNETNDIRDVRLAVSKDFRMWEFVDFIKYEDQKEIQLYTNQISQYYRDPKTLIGFPVRYCDRVCEKENFKHMPLANIRRSIIKKEGRKGTAVTDCAIMTSNDGINFNRRSTAFFTPGMETDTNWWYGNCYTVYGMIETLADDGENHEISMYMGENYRVKNVNFRRYTVRLDGFFSWFGDGDGGEVVTKPFVLENENMFVNFSTSALGGLEIGVLDERGKEIEGYQDALLFGDSTNRPVEFKKSLKTLIGKEITLRFRLNDCHLYSYTFES